MSVLAAVVVAALVGCGGGDEPDEPRADRNQWSAYNEGRDGYDATATAVAKSVVDRIVAGGIACDQFAEYPFDLIASGYRLRDMPLALGAGNCAAANEEDILVEVFGRRPSAADFVAAKRRVICKRAKENGRLPDGTSDFDGIPYVMAEDETWIVEPDDFKTAKAIGEKLGRPSRDMCAGIK